MPRKCSPSKVLYRKNLERCKSDCSEFTVSAVISAVKLVKNSKKTMDMKVYIQRTLSMVLVCNLYFYLFCSLLCYALATLQIACY